MNRYLGGYSGFREQGSRNNSKLRAGLLCAGVLLVCIASCAIVFSGEPKAAPELGRTSQLLVQVIAGNRKAPSGIKVFAVIEYLDGKPDVQIEATRVTNEDGECYFEGLSNSDRGYRRYMVAYRPGELLGCEMIEEHGWSPGERRNSHISPFGGSHSAGYTKLAAFKLGTVRGRVVDEKGKPIAGVTVRTCVGSLDAPAISAVTGLSAAITDKNGNFALKSAPVAVPNRHFQVTKRGYVSVYWGTRNRVVTMPKSRSVYGRVVDASGRPLSGLLVVLEPYRQFISTAADGSYKFSGLTPDHYEITLAPNREHILAEHLWIVLGKSGQTTKAPDMIAARGAIVMGRVVIAGVGEPAYGYFRALDKSKATRSFFEPDCSFDRGQFTCWLLPRKTYELEYTNLNEASKVRLNVRVPQDKLIGLILTAKPKWSVGHGRIVDERGKPIAGAEVYLREYYAEYSTCTDGWSVSNLDGRFVVSLRVARGRKQKVADPVTVDVFSADRRMGIIRKLPKRDLLSGKAAFVLRPTAPLRVAVRDAATRRPMLGASIHCLQRLVLTNPDGLAVVAIAGGGRQMLTITKHGYVTRQVELPEAGTNFWTGALEVSLKPGK